ncbi:hypothetical protein DSLASN_11930 [Desulfoluna limicola]|uniref:Uncharacterized protein n=1 Tax=Desulfoluna limicola TaxID=2810562 RepID=A0ABM7PEH8_9BACT|nr:hypothetical protein DSLASN_11930 [Desulfoluna limicola]
MAQKLNRYKGFMVDFPHAQRYECVCIEATLAKSSLLSLDMPSHELNMFHLWVTMGLV